MKKIGRGSVYSEEGRVAAEVNENPVVRKRGSGGGFCILNFVVCTLYFVFCILRGQQNLSGREERLSCQSQNFSTGFT